MRDQQGTTSRRSACPGTCPVQHSGSLCQWSARLCCFRPSALTLLLHSYAFQQPYRIFLISQKPNLPELVSKAHKGRSCLPLATLEPLLRNATRVPKAGQKVESHAFNWLPTISHPYSLFPSVSMPQPSVPYSRTGHPFHAHSTAVSCCLFRKIPCAVYVIINLRHSFAFIFYNFTDL